MTVTKSNRLRESKEDLKSELERNKRRENEDPIREEKKRKNNFIRNTYIHIGEIKNKKNRKERKMKIKEKSKIRI